MEEVTNTANNYKYETVTTIETGNDMKCSDCKIPLLYNTAYLKNDGSTVCDYCAFPSLQKNNTTVVESHKTTLPNVVEENLKCGKCAEVLCCSPIYLTLDGGAICGRCCFNSNEKVIRNSQYESLAKLFTFPCRFRKFGCPATVPFMENCQESQHELMCVFRKEKCPVFDVGACKWQGARSEFLEHSKNAHSDRVAVYPCAINYSFDKSTVFTFLFTHFEKLFLFHTKVCLNSDKVYFTVQYLTSDDETVINNIKYQLIITKNDKMLLTLLGRVTSYCQFDYSSNNFNYIYLSKLRQTIANLNNCLFKIIMTNMENLQSQCLHCFSKLIDTPNNEVCSFCKKTLMKKCKNESCTYVDFAVKCSKHELYFCPMGKWCWLCNKNIDQFDLVKHYLMEHSSQIYKVNSSFTIQQHEHYEQNVLLSFDLGLILCKFRFSDVDFALKIRCPILNNYLQKYKCVVSLQVGQELSNVELKLIQNESYDWEMICHKTKFKVWPAAINLCINIHEVLNKN